VILTSGARTMNWIRTRCYVTPNDEGRQSRRFCRNRLIESTAESAGGKQVKPWITWGDGLTEKLSGMWGVHCETCDRQVNAPGPAPGFVTQPAAKFVTSLTHLKGDVIDVFLLAQ